MENYIFFLLQAEVGEIASYTAFKSPSQQNNFQHFSDDITRQYLTKDKTYILDTLNCFERLQLRLTKLT